MRKEGEGGDGDKKARYSRFTRAIFWCLTIFILLTGLGALLEFLGYLPSNPKFSIMGEAVYDLNNSSPTATFISTSMQFTITSLHPTDLSSNYDGSLAVYLTYSNEAITPPTPMQGMYYWRKAARLPCLQPPVEGSCRSRWTWLVDF